MNKPEKATRRVSAAHRKIWNAKRKEARTALKGWNKTGADFDTALTAYLLVKAWEPTP